MPASLREWIQGHSEVVIHESAVSSRIVTHEFQHTTVSYRNQSVAGGVAAEPTTTIFNPLPSVSFQPHLFFISIFHAARPTTPNSQPLSASWGPGFHSTITTFIFICSGLWILDSGSAIQGTGVDRPSFEPTGAPRWRAISLAARPPFSFSSTPAILGVPLFTR